MNFTNLFRIAVKALSNNKLRGFLTMLGIIIGVASVITMLAIGQGSKRSIQSVHRVSTVRACTAQQMRKHSPACSACQPQKAFRLMRSRSSV